MKVKIVKWGHRLDPGMDVWIWEYQPGESGMSESGIFQLPRGKYDLDEQRRAILEALVAVREISRHDADYMLKDYDEANGQGYYLHMMGPWHQQGALTHPEATGVLSTPERDQHVEVINRHRAKMGRQPIDLSAGWSSEELKDMAESIRKYGRETNPRTRKLRRSLLR